MEDELGPLVESARRLVEALALFPLARFLPRNRLGRPCKSRTSVAAAFLAKSIYGFSDTRQLIEQLKTNEQLRRCCGWRHASQVPHESTFSRAFAAFARAQLAQHWHAAVIEKTQSQRLIGHIPRDSSAIPVRERLPEKLFLKRQKGKPPKMRKPVHARRRTAARW